MIWLILLRPDTVWRCQPLPKAACFDREVDSRVALPPPVPPPHPLELDLNSIPVALNVLSVYTCDAVYKLNAVSWEANNNYNTQQRCYTRAIVSSPTVRMYHCR